MAGVTGFEPVLTVLETAVLPLTPHPYVVTAFVLYNPKLYLTSVQEKTISDEMVYLFTGFRYVDDHGILNRPIHHKRSYNYRSRSFRKNVSSFFIEVKVIANVITFLLNYI